MRVQQPGRSLQLAIAARLYLSSVLLPRSRDGQRQTEFNAWRATLQDEEAPLETSSRASFNSLPPPSPIKFCGTHGQHRRFQLSCQIWSGSAGRFSTSPSAFKILISITALSRFATRADTHSAYRPVTKTPEGFAEGDGSQRLASTLTLQNEQKCLISATCQILWL